MQSMQFPVEKLAEQVLELFNKGGTLGDVYGYTETDYEVVYTLGSNLYKQGRYSDAMKAFGFLVIHNQWERRYVSAFAATLHMLKHYEDAIQYYSLASVMDMRDPVPTFHTAECMIPLGRLDDAKEALGFVILQSRDERYASLKARAQAMLDSLVANERKPKDREGDHDANSK
ncbi:SycD/LcrH family type III secretion system chaperone [Noviherbaspirillum sp.]|jgi:type III secretion system low calcium response chaperone LcrH/SycD|uniref:SycD/LcrH family type III secretion system chaperone n=1 Tax=Noviherbaspirillum sp. TaxID=1926288 RepID=UPI0025EA1D89|nr:SycD/LcrH family type III secretion system chaperone [Noviherbaspirillum sp.]